MVPSQSAATVVAFLLAGGLVGGLILSAGLLTEPVAANDTGPLECGTFPVTLESTSEFRFTARAGQPVHLEVDFLDLDGDIIQTRQLDLAAGATTVFAMPTRYVGIAIQVIPSAPVQVQTAYISPGGAGGAERQVVPCKHIARPVRHGGP